MSKLTPCLLCCIWFALYVTEISSKTPINLNRYLQPDEVTEEQFNSRKYCARPCIPNEPPRICYYLWVVEDYVTVSQACGDCPNNKTDCYAPQCVPADGWEKGIITVNRRFPGPSIQVCIGDRIIIDYTNRLAARSTTIHWHGVFQKGTPYMDGVPGVTQCAIPEGNTFRYDFLANNEGTHYWHSHDGLQKLDGIQGSLIIRIPKQDEPNKHLYDDDGPNGIIMILDWMHIKSDDKFPGYRFHWLGQDPDSILMNGFGRTELPPEQGNRSSDYPLAVVNVSQNKRYRLRIIGALCTVCGVQLTIEGHNMTVIATDGNPVKPVVVSSLVIYSGERYDVVITANQRPGNYWIHLKGLQLCAQNSVFGLATLSYISAATEELNSEEPDYDGIATSGGRILNPENATCGGDTNNICVTDLQSASHSEVGRSQCHITMPLTFGFHVYSVENLFVPNRYDLYYVVPTGELLLSWMNNISYVAASSPLLSQNRESSKSICSSGKNGVPTCPAYTKEEPPCECANVIKIPLGCTITLMITDSTPTGNLHHPFHLHGHAFQVIAMGQFKNGQTQQDVYAKLKSGKLPLATKSALKDAVAVPSNGYVVIRFFTDNPGFWFFHCHFMYHLATGMALVFQVGGPRDWPPVPAGFPRCGNYQPTLYYEDYYYDY